MRLYRTRANYWSLSPFSEWLRTKAGLTNPYALSSEGWAEHHKECKRIAPITYWITDVLFDKIQSFLRLPYDLVHSVRVYRKNAKQHTHMLSGSLEKGQWYDLTSRIPHCLFSELEKFIEQEKGLEFHKWEQSLVFNEDMFYTEEHEEFGKPTPQTLAAMEQDVIYQWWKANKDVDLYEVSGFNAIYETWEDDDFSSFLSASRRKTHGYKAAMDKLKELEEKYEQEETEMLIRLIKIRGSLWS